MMDLDDILRIERAILSFSGLHPDRTGRYKFFRKISATVVSMISTLLFICVFAVALTSSEFTGEVIEALLFDAAQFGYIIKLFNNLLHQENFERLERFMEDPSFIPRAGVQERIWKDAIFTGKTFGIIFGVSAAVTMSFYSSLPIFDDTRTQFTLPVWVPFDKYHYYWTVNIAIMFALNLSGSCGLILDVTACKFILIGSAKLEILGDKITNAVKEGRDEELVVKELRECIIHSNNIYSFIAEIDDIYTYPILGQLFCSILVICTTGFQMIVIPMDNVQAMTYGTYFICMGCQIAMYCWFGHKVVENSDKLTRACYDTDWYAYGVKVGKLLITVMERAKVPIILKAGRIFPLTLQTLISIFRTSYSCFAVLQEMYSD